jgi:ankyrin repeat protein
LCKAIEENDVGEIDRLVAAGADVNAKGKENMTPLLWAFPDDKPERFKKLLELGADPNARLPQSELGFPFAGGLGCRRRLPGPRSCKRPRSGVADV